MEERLIKPSTVVLQALILVFSVCFVWFTIVYYPKIVRERSFAVSLTPFAPKVVVNAESFPIKTSDYRITHAEDSGLYYVFVEGKTLDAYIESKNAAQLALKNALSVESLCNQKIIFASSAKIEIPAEYKTTSNCN